MSQYAPPPILVKTWLQLFGLNSEPEAAAHAKRMINKISVSCDLQYRRPALFILPQL